MINELNKDLYKTDWRWYEDGYEVTRTSVWTGPGCHNGCGVLRSSAWKAIPILLIARVVCACAASTWLSRSTTMTA